MNATTNPTAPATTEKPLAVGDGMTMHYPNDAYPFVIVALSASGKTAKVRKLKPVDVTTGHHPHHFEGPFPVWSHSYTAEERASMVVVEKDYEGNDLEPRVVRLTKNGWTSQGAPFTAGEAVYHRNYAY